METQNISQDSEMKAEMQMNKQEKQPFKLANSSPIANLIIEQLLGSCMNEIRQKQLISHAPSFIHFNLMNLLGQYIQQSIPNYGTSKPSDLQEDNISSIVKIQKDNLSPKQLPSQHLEKDQVVRDLPEVLSSVGSRRLNLTNRSSFLRVKPSKTSQIPLGATPDRNKLQKNNNSFKSNQVSPQKNKKSVSVKKDSLQNFTLVCVPQSQDPQIIYLREKIQFKNKQKEKEKSLHNQRLKEEQQKISNFNSQFGQNKSYTFDFDGRTIGAETNDNDRINYYSMKVGVKTLGKKFRTIYKHLDDASSQLNQSQQRVIKSKNSKGKQHASQTIDFFNSSLQIPVFKEQQKELTLDPSKLKIIEYKRLYDRRFSRYDKNHVTIDVSSIMDSNKITQEDNFLSKKHLTDSLSINKSRSSSVKREYQARKLALPKLQGRYKVLDRYQQI